MSQIRKLAVTPAQRWALAQMFLADELNRGLRGMNDQSRFKRAYQAFGLAAALRSAVLHGRVSMALANDQKTKHLVEITDENRDFFIKVVMELVPMTTVARVLLEEVIDALAADVASPAPEGVPDLASVSEDWAPSADDVIGK